MIKLVLVKERVPAGLIGIVLEHDKLEGGLPFRVKAKDLVNQVRTADSADDGVACGHEGVDDVGSDKGVCAGEESQSHFGDAMFSSWGRWDGVWWDG